MTIQIPENDFGQIRVFATDGPLPKPVLDKTPDGLRQLLGTDALDPTFIDIVKVDDLGPMQLSDYITQGYDMLTADHDLAAVNGIEGFAILILSSAARGQAVTLKPADGVRHITTYVPDARLTPVEPLTAKSAEGVIGDPPAKPAKSDARIGGMIAMYALIAMFLLVGLMIWVAG